MEKKHPSNLRQKVSFPWQLFLFLFLLSLFILMIISYLLSSTYQITGKYSPLIQQIMKIKFETTISHLWQEEVLNGDSNMTEQEAIYPIDKACLYAEMFLQKKKNLPSKKLEKKFQSLFRILLQLKKIGKKRFSLQRKKLSLSATDHQYDATFLIFLEQAKNIEKELHQIVFQKLSSFKNCMFFLISLCVFFTFLVLFLFCGYEKRQQQTLFSLQEAKNKAESKVKILSGLLPICASCKKIRDKQGNWKQIEGYIKKNSEAEFSHGICPGCKEELYGDLLKNSPKPEIN